MKYMKIILCFILAAGLTASAACRSGDKNGELKLEGRYVESNITPPVEGRFMSLMANGGSVVCFSEGLLTRYESVDGGESWALTDGPGKDTDRYGGVNSGTFLPDGRLLVYLQGEGLTAVSADGGSEPFPVAEIDEIIAKGENILFSFIQVLGDSRLLLSYTNVGFMRMQRPAGDSGQDGARVAPAAGYAGAAVIDTQIQVQESQERVQQRPASQEGGFSMSPAAQKTALYDLSNGKLINELPLDNPAAVTSLDNKIYILNTAGNIFSYDLTDGAPTGQSAVTLGTGGGAAGMMMISRMMGGGNVLTANENGGIYAFYNGNLLLYDAEREVSTVLEGTAYSFGSPNCTVNAVHVLQNGEIIINILDFNQSSFLYKYTWDENASVDPKKILSVWSLEENAFVRAVIAELRKKHPDSYISYEVALSGDNAVSSADAVKTLNTRLLSGSGPDILIMDGVPLDSYAGRGMLLELTSHINTGDIYPNLIEPYKANQKLYALPAQFMLPALLGSRDALNKAKTLDELVNLIVNGNDAAANRRGGGAFTGIPENERPEIYFESMRELFNIFWYASASAVVSENKLDSEALKTFLEAVKAVSDKYNLGEQGSQGRMGMMTAAFFGGGGRTSIITGSLMRYTGQMSNYAAFMVNNLLILQMMMDRAGSELALFPGMVSGAWQPAAVTGISAGTFVPDFALEYIKAMLSVDVQQVNYGEGMPVTKAGMDGQLRDINERLQEMERGPFTIDLDSLVQRLQAPFTMDTTLTGMIWGTVESLCTGSVSTEEAVREIEKNIRNFLAERS